MLLLHIKVRAWYVLAKVVIAWNSILVSTWITVKDTNRNSNQNKPSKLLNEKRGILL